MFEDIMRHEHDDDSTFAEEVLRRVEVIDRRYRRLSERALILVVLEGQNQILTEIRAMAVDMSRVTTAVAAIAAIIAGLKTQVQTLSDNEAVAGDTEAQATVNSIADQLEALDGHVTTVATAAAGDGSGASTGGGANTGTPPSIT